MTSSDSSARLLAAVEAAFAETGRGLSPWPDPHPDRSPADGEYSRVTDPERLRIIDARATAWTIALVEQGHARLESDTTIDWRERPGSRITRTHRLVPHTASALPLVLARSEIAGVPDAGLTVGVGDPAVLVALVPDCGCDACDSGSDDLLDDLDQQLIDLVTGRFRHLRRGAATIIVLGNRIRVTGSHRLDIERTLADPSGWDELTGASWIETTA